MENTRIPEKGFLEIPHLPTLCLLVGYVTYWVELYFLNSRTGKTTPLAAILFFTLLIIAVIRQRHYIHAAINDFRRGWKNGGRGLKNFLTINGTMAAGIMFLVIYVSFLPPHLTQEFDALNYHLTIPRQHLIAGSFQHLAWSSADLFPLPLDFALAPYWFMTELPNKLPQLLFLAGLVLVSLNLVNRLSKAEFGSISLALFAILSLHCLAIQMGTAMLDIVICYLFVAALDSFLKGNALMGSVEATFFLWSKSFIPFQAVFIVAVLLLLHIILKRLGFKDMRLGFEKTADLESRMQYSRNFKKMAIYIGVLSFFIAGPFIIKSTYYSGTPLFPFAPGIINVNKSIDRHSPEWESLLASSRTHLSVKDKYGYSRSLTDFVRSLWHLAVPDKGVNNKFDYPAGLTYLLFLGPFLYFLAYSIERKQFPLLPIITAIYWVSWWTGSQQTRFLYIPIILMIITVSPQIKKPTVVLMSVITISMAFTCISLFRAYKGELGKRQIETLRPADRELVNESKMYLEEKRKDTVYLEHFDVAYARFPVMVTKPDSFWVLQTGKVVAK